MAGAAQAAGVEFDPAALVNALGLARRSLVYASIAARNLLNARDDTREETIRRAARVAADHAAQTAVTSMAQAARAVWHAAQALHCRAKTHRAAGASGAIISPSLERFSVRTAIVAAGAALDAVAALRAAVTSEAVVDLTHRTVAAALALDKHASAFALACDAYERSVPRCPRRPAQDATAADADDLVRAAAARLDRAACALRELRGRCEAP